MKKLLPVIMAIVMVFSTFAIISIAGADDSLVDGKFQLAAGTNSGNAAKFALSETVYGTVEGDSASYYKFFVEETKDVLLSVRANNILDITVEKSDGTVINTVSGKECNLQLTALASANYTVIIKNYVEPTTEEPTTEETVTDESTTEETVVEEESSTDMTAEEESSMAGSNDFGGLSLMSVQSDEPVVTEFYFCATTDTVKPLGVDINYKKATLVAGESLQLTLDPTVDNLNFFWRVYDDPKTAVNENEIASVTADGLVTIKNNSSFFNKDTNVTIQAVTYYNNEEATKSCVITAVLANVFLDPYYGASESNCLKLGVGAYRSISATTNVKGKNIVWSSPDENIATVSPSGKITATGVGKVKVKAEIEGMGIAREILVVVADNYSTVMGVSFNNHTASVRANENFKAEYTFKTAPANVFPTNSKVTFTSSNPAVATVDADGKVTGVAEGTAEITITTDDGKYTDKCTVTVTAPIPNWLMVIIAPLRLIYNLILMIIGG